MTVRQDGNVIEVVLSKRNLLALLSKVDDQQSARQLFRQDGSRYLVVRVETDQEHYSDRPPGAVHPKAEAFISAYQGDPR